MSDSEAPRDSLFSSVEALSETWSGPVVVSDLAKQCCEGKTTGPLPLLRRSSTMPSAALWSVCRTSFLTNSPFSRTRTPTLSLSQLSLPDRTAYGVPFEEGARPCFTVDNVLSREECSAIVEASL